MIPLSSEYNLIDSEYIKSLMNSLGIEKVDIDKWQSVTEIEQQIAQINCDSLPENKCSSKKRGRKARTEITNEKMSSKKIRFGNSYVEKNSPVYANLRRRNNQAVERCRKKKAAFDKLNILKMNSILNENEFLRKKVEHISKELEYFKQVDIKPVNIQNI